MWEASFVGKGAGFHEVLCLHMRNGGWHTATSQNVVWAGGWDCLQGVRGQHAEHPTCRCCSALRKRTSR